jgi:hypothetical protein
MSSFAIPLSGGKAVALVDPACFAFLNQWNWSVDQECYAYRTLTISGSSFALQMHRVILGAPTGVEIDHKNGNTLDNRISNLRFASRSQNNRNRGANVTRREGQRFKGVYRNRNCSTYTARLTCKDGDAKRHIYIGSFKTEQEAAAAYDAEARRRFGEFARLNFPDQAA